MPRSLTFAALAAVAACGPAPRSITPVPQPVDDRVVAAKGRAGAGYALVTPPPHQPGSMPVMVPDTSRLERMPVFRPDSTIDRKMVVRSGRRFVVSGPGGVEPGPPLDSVLRVAPRP